MRENLPLRRRKGTVRPVLFFVGSLRNFGALCLCIGFGTHSVKGGRSPKRHLGIGFEGGSAGMYGRVPPGPAVAQPLLLLRCVVSHRIAPGEFLSGGFYVQAPVQFHPPRRALLWKAVAARLSRLVKS